MPNSRSEEKMYALEGAALKRAQKTYPDAMSYYYLDSLGKNQEFILQLFRTVAPLFFRKMADGLLVDVLVANVIETEQEGIHRIETEFFLKDPSLQNNKELVWLGKVSYSFVSNEKKEVILNDFSCTNNLYQFFSATEEKVASEQYAFLKQAILNAQNHSDFVLSKRIFNKLLFFDDQDNIDLTNMRLKQEHVDSLIQYQLFKRCNFTDTDLTNADLTNADLTNANLTGAIFSNTNKFTGAKTDGITLKNFTYRIIDANGIVASLDNIDTKTFVAHIADQCEIINKKAFESFFKKNCAGKTAAQQLIIILQYIEVHSKNEKESANVILQGFNQAIYKLYKTQEISTNDGEPLSERQCHDLNMLALKSSLSARIFPDQAKVFSQKPVPDEDFLPERKTTKITKRIDIDDASHSKLVGKAAIAKKTTTGGSSVATSSEVARNNVTRIITLSNLTKINDWRNREAGIAALNSLGEKKQKELIDATKPIIYEIYAISPTQADYPRGYGSVASASSKQLIARLNFIPENFYKDFRKILKTLKLNAATRAFIKESDRGIFSFNHSMGERFLLMLQHVELNETVKQAFNQTYYNFYKADCAKKLNAYTTIDADKRAIVESLLNLAAQFKIPADLSGLNLSGADLKNLDLSHARLKNANLKRAELTSTDQKVYLPVKNDAYPNLQATLSVGIKELYEKVHSNYNEKLKTRSFLKKIGDFFSFNRHQFFENLEKKNLSADEKMDRVRKQASNKPNSLTRAALSDSTGELAKKYKFKVEAKDINASNIQLLLKWMSEGKFVPTSTQFPSIMSYVARQQKNFAGMKLTREQVDCIIANKDQPDVANVLVGADLSGVDLRGVIFSYSVSGENVYFNLSNVKVDKNTKTDSEEQLHYTDFPVEQFSVLGFGADEKNTRFTLDEPSAVELKPDDPSSKSFVQPPPEESAVVHASPKPVLNEKPITTAVSAVIHGLPGDVNVRDPKTALQVEYLATILNKHIGVGKEINKNRTYMDSKTYAGIVSIAEDRAGNYVFSGAQSDVLVDFKSALEAYAKDLQFEKTFDFMLHDAKRSHFTLLSVTVNSITKEITIVNLDTKFHAANSAWAKQLDLTKKENAIKTVVQKIFPEYEIANTPIYQKAMLSDDESDQQIANTCGDRTLARLLLRYAGENAQTFSGLYNSDESIMRGATLALYQDALKTESQRDLTKKVTQLNTPQPAPARTVAEEKSITPSTKPRANSAPVVKTPLEQAFSESEDEAAAKPEELASSLNPPLTPTTPDTSPIPNVSSLEENPIIIAAKVTQSNVASQRAATLTPTPEPAQAGETTPPPTPTTELPAQAGALPAVASFHTSFAGAITYFKGDSDGQKAIDELLNSKQEYQFVSIDYRQGYHQAPITNDQQCSVSLSVVFRDKNNAVNREYISIVATQLDNGKIKWTIETKTNDSRIDPNTIAILLATISLKTRENQYPAGNANNINFKEVCLGDDEIHMVNAHLDAGFVKVICNGKTYDKDSKAPEPKSLLTGRGSPSMFSSNTSLPPSSSPENTPNQKPR